MGLAAHEDIEGGIAVFGPAVNRDMRFGEHRHARHSTVRREVMEMDVQERRSSDLDATSKRRFDVL
jgi:hypothetical protein